VMISSLVILRFWFGFDTSSLPDGSTRGGGSPFKIHGVQDNLCALWEQ
jgi:hypothetical protein